MESAASRDESAADHEGLAELDEQLTAAVARVYRRMRSQRTPGQLGEGAMAVLAHLYRFGPKSLGALSDTERVTPASMSQTVNRLVELDYARRTPDPSDGRRVLFELTESGAELAQEARRRRHAWLRERLAGRTEAERALLGEAARVLLELAD